MIALAFAQVLITGLDPNLSVTPGPELPPSMPGKCVVLTLTGGPGTLTEEGAFTAVSFQVRSIGEQNDPDSAEKLAWDLDRLFRAVPTQTVQVPADPAPVLVRLMSVARSGSPPSPLMVDDADRHHFVASYIATVGSL